MLECKISLISVICKMVIHMQKPLNIFWTWGVLVFKAKVSVGLGGGGGFLANYS